MAKKTTQTPAVKTAGVNTDNASAYKAATEKAEADKAAAEKAEADKAATEKAEADKAAAEKAEADKAAAEAKESFAFQGKNYGFSDRMPEKLKVYGVLYSKEELLNNDDAMTSLIVGNSPFVKKV